MTELEPKAARSETVRSQPGARRAVRGQGSLARDAQLPARPSEFEPEFLHPSDERGTQRHRDRGPQSRGFPGRGLGPAHADCPPGCRRGEARCGVPALAGAAGRLSRAVPRDELPVPDHDADPVADRAAGGGEPQLRGGGHGRHSGRHRILPGRRKTSNSPPCSTSSLPTKCSTFASPTSGSRKSSIATVPGQ